MSGYGYVGSPYFNSFSRWGMPTFSSGDGGAAPNMSSLPMAPVSPNMSGLSSIPNPDVASVPWDDNWHGGTLNGFFDSTDKNGGKTQGWGNTALGAANGLFNGWMAMQQYGLMKDQLAESKRQFGLNYGAQRNITNASLEDRQRARVASNPGAYQSVGDYMKQHAIPGG